jgi:tetratricopeptide (TPR) repeat protein
MPSHIFTRLGLWEECILSNLKSVEAAKCYAESSGMKGHWDEELHGLDYLIYAYLQRADDEKAMELLNYLATITEVFPVNFKDAYCFASMPARYALERKDWALAAALKLAPADFPWDKFLWEKANLHFARSLGNTRTNKIETAKTELRELESIHANLSRANEIYKANLVMIQIKTARAWIALAERNPQQSIQLMTEAADMEDATAKHPVTPGEIIPARELLGDMYLEMNQPAKALEAYEADLANHANRFNGLYGAGQAEEKIGNTEKAVLYYKQLLAMAKPSNSNRPQLQAVESFVRNNGGTPD